MEDNEKILTITHSFDEVKCYNNFKESRRGNERFLLLKTVLLV